MSQTFLKLDTGVTGTLPTSNYVQGGITMADSWRITSSFTNSANPIASNWERADTFGQTYPGADLHTTNTTSQVDYQVYLKVNAGTVFINNDSQLTITLMEILA